MPAARKAKTPKPTDTEYVVLEQLPSGKLTYHEKHGTANLDGERVIEGAWIEVDRVTAHGQEKPIVEKWANEKGRGGAFRLVPARSWKGGVRIFEQTRMTSEPLG